MRTENRTKAKSVVTISYGGEKNDSLTERLIQPEDASGGIEMNILTDEPDIGLYERSLDLRSLPTFNAMGSSGLARVIRDTDGSFLHVIHALSEAALWVVPDQELTPGKKKKDCESFGWRERNWETLLSITRFDQFEWDPAGKHRSEWPATEVFEKFSNRLGRYNLFKSTEKPWDFPEFRKLQRHIDENRELFDSLLRVGFIEADKLREQKNIPTRQLVFLGDMVCGRAPTAGDMAVVRVFEQAVTHVKEVAINAAIANSLSIEEAEATAKSPVTVLASNHGCYLLQLQSFLNARFGDSFVKYLREHTSDIQDQDCELTEEMSNVLVTALQDSLKKTKSEALREAKRKGLDPRGTKGNIARNELIDSLRRQQKNRSLGHKTAEAIFQFIRSIPFYFLAPYEAEALPKRLQKLLSFSPIRNSVLRRIVIKKPAILSEPGEIHDLLWGIINAYTDLTEENESILRKPPNVISREEREPLKEILLEIDCFRIFSNPERMNRLSKKIRANSEGMSQEEHNSLIQKFNAVNDAMMLRAKKLEILKKILTSNHALTKEAEMHAPFLQAISLHPDLTDEDKGILSTSLTEEDRKGSKKSKDDKSLRLRTRKLLILKRMLGEETDLLTEVGGIYPPLLEAITSELPPELNLTPDDESILIAPPVRVSQDDAKPLKKYITSEIGVFSVFQPGNDKQMKQIEKKVYFKKNHDELTDNEYNSLLQKIEDIRNSTRSKNKRLGILTDILATTEPNACFDVNNDKLMNELLHLRGKEEIFTDLKSLLDECLMAFESVLRQATILPRSLHIEPSAIPLLAELLPRNSVSTIEREDKVIKDSNGDTHLTVRLKQEERVVGSLSCCLVKSGTPIANKEKEAFDSQVNQVQEAYEKDPDVNVLDEWGRPTKHVGKRATAMRDYVEAWSDAMTLVIRLGRTYARHAPAVGLKGETSDESMMNHAYIPLAEIIQSVLQANIGESSSLDDESSLLLKPLIKELKESVSDIRAHEITYNPVVDKNIARLEDALNKSFDLLKTNNLLVLEFTPNIPKTHLGFLSPLEDKEKYNFLIDVLKRSGRLPEDFQPGDLPFDHIMCDYGSETMRNPILALLFPFAAWVWNRSYESVTYSDKETSEVLLTTQSVSNVVHGHTSEPGPHLMGTDRRFKLGNPVIEDCYALLPPALPSDNHVSLNDILGNSSNYEPNAFWPGLFKQLIELDIKEKRKRSQTFSTNETLLIDEDLSQDDLTCKIICDASTQIESLVAKGIETPEMIKATLDSMLRSLANKMDSSDDANHLKERITLALEYLPDEREACDRASRAGSIIMGLYRNGNNVAPQLSFWFALYILSPNNLALMREGLAKYFLLSQEEKDIPHPYALAAYLNMEAFYDSLDGEVNDTLVLTNILPKHLALRVSEFKKRTRIGKWRLISKPLAMPFAVASGLTTSSLVAVYFQRNAEIGNTLTIITRWDVLAGAIILFELLFLLSEINGKKLPQKTQRFLNGVERFFPRDTSASQLPAFALFLAPFLWVEFAIVINDIYKWLSGEIPYCSAENNNTEQATTESLSQSTTTELNNETTPDLSYAESNPSWVIPAFAVGAMTGVTAFVLSVWFKENLSPGHKPPANNIGHRQTMSPCKRRVHDFGRGYSNWVSGNLVILVGSFAVLVFSGLSCGNPESAVTSSCVTFASLLVRFVAYPPKWATSGCSKLRESICPKQTQLVKLLILSDQRKKIVAIIYETIAALFTLPLRFFLTGYYGAVFIGQNGLEPRYEETTFMQTFMDTNTNKVLFGLTFTGCVITFIDDMLVLVERRQEEKHREKADIALAASSSSRKISVTFEKGGRSRAPGFFANSGKQGGGKRGTYNTKKGGRDHYIGPPPRFNE